MGFEVLLKAVEAAAPEALVEGEPILGRTESVGVEVHHTAASAALAADERGALEDVEVLGYGGERDGVRLGDLADGFFAACDVAQDGAAGGVGQGVEDGVECGGASIEGV